MAITSATARTAAAILALLAWTGLAVQCAAILPRSASFIETLWAMLRFFTITSNLLLAVVMTGVALGKTAFSTPRLLGGVALAMAFVGGVYITLLRGRPDLSGGDLFADLILHYLTPTAATVFWLLFRPRGGLRAGDPLLWALYPLAYGIYAVARGAFDGRYPYPFLDVAQIGAAQAAANMALLWVLFIAAGAVLVWFDHRRSGQARHP